MIWVDFAILLACLFFGARLGGIALGTVAAFGLAVFTFIFREKPGTIPIDVIIIIFCVICAAAALEAAGGLDWMVRLAERILRKRPESITFVAPVVAYFFTFFAGTGHVAYSILPVIAEVAEKAGVRPERPLSIAVIASQRAITASPLSAATAGMVALMAKNNSTFGLKDILLICVPSTLLGVLIGAVSVFRMGRELADDPIYQERLRTGAIQPPTPSSAHTASTPSERWSVGLFLGAAMLIMLFGLIPELRPAFPAQGGATRLGMVETISIVMLAASAAIVIATKTKPEKIVSGRVMHAGIVAAVSILGIAWLGSTFFEVHRTEILSSISETVKLYPWIFSLGLFVLSIFLYSQAATVAAIMHVGVTLGIPFPLLIAMFPAVNGYFFFPTYGTVIAAINFDYTGTTTAGRYLVDHSFMRAGMIATIAAVVIGILIVKVFY